MRQVAQSPEPALSSHPSDCVEYDSGSRCTRRRHDVVSPFGDVQRPALPTEYPRNRDCYKVQTKLIGGAPWPIRDRRIGE